jgi:ankyrin repeat protein
MPSIQEIQQAAQELNDAIAAGKTEVVEALIRNGVSVNAPDRHGQTPMLIAARNGKTDLVRLLYEHGAAVDVGNSERAGRRPLYWASEEGHINVVRLLIELGADINAVDNHEQSALYTASLSLANQALNVSDIAGWIRSQNEEPTGKAAVVEFLIQKGADVNRVKKGNHSPAKFIRDTRIPRLVALLHGREKVRSLWSRLSGGD